MASDGGASDEMRELGPDGVVFIRFFATKLNPNLNPDLTLSGRWLTCARRR